ncbi:MAG: DUF86 domain-containing protein [Rhodospirillales bacterium]|nr:DUF86 domain-containing protein [Rhodospirillales bacterium]
MNRDAIHLVDIVKSAHRIRDYVSGTSRLDFLENTQLQDSVIRRLEIIGEAAGRVSPEFRDENPGIPWSKMKGMRNWMIHRYDDIDMDVVWETVERDIPGLIGQLESLLSDQQS